MLAGEMRKAVGDGAKIHASIQPVLITGHWLLVFLVLSLPRVLQLQDQPKQRTMEDE